MESVGNGSKNEVLADFKDALEKIDFGAYNPNSQEFRNALDIGLMCFLLCKMFSDDVELPLPKEEEKSDDDIAEEISGAKKYLQKFIDTGDESYRGMSADELRHASTLIKKANSRLPGGEEKLRLKSYEKEIQEITAQM